MKNFSLLSSGFALLSVRCPPFNAVLACNADRMCQQIEPNETHLQGSLEHAASLRSTSCQRGDTLIALAPDPPPPPSTF